MPSPNHHILFVCTGNTGRSVAAAALARHLIVTRGLALMVGSRGVAVDLTNTRPEAPVVDLLASRGIDVSAHRATRLIGADVAGADCLLTMTASHKRIVLDRFPASAGKVRMLSELADGTETDVADAFGSAVAVYQRLLTDLDVMVTRALDRLIPRGM